MTPKEREAMQQALDFIDYFVFNGDNATKAKSISTALREALDQDIDCPCGSECIKCSPRVLLAEQAEQEPEYDLSNVIHLTHNKAKHIIESRGYFVTGFVLTREDGGKCIVDMSAVRWFDDKLVFQRMMHSDTPKEWLSLPVELVKQEPVGEVKILRMYTDDSKFHYVDCQHLPEGTKLYDTPVRIKDLTDDEIDRIACNVSHKEFARAVIAAYKEKNK